MDVHNNVLYWGGVDCRTFSSEYGTPLYVYDADIIRSRYQELRKNIMYDKVKILYASKANTSLAVLDLIRSFGCGLDTVSPGEIYLGLHVGFNPEDILFTGNNSTEEDMLYCLEQGVMVNIGSLAQMDVYGRIAPGTEISVRINPDIGAGHHDHCITGGPDSKFGIYHDLVDEIKKRAHTYNLRIVGIHSHIGSGILDTDTYLRALNIILDAAHSFDDLDMIDCGGGIGIPYQPDEKPVNIKTLGEAIGKRFSRFCDEYGKKLTLVLEPGRFLVAESGILLVRANNRKETPRHVFIGTDSGFNHLIRPMAYGSYHKIVNASSVTGTMENVVIAGNLCESGDVFTRDEHGIVGRDISVISNGDILAILDAGAYGFSMASHYNSRCLPAEVMVDNGKHRLIRMREKFSDFLNGQFV